MPQKVKIKSILQDASTIRTVWNLNPDVTAGPIGVKEFNALLDSAEDLTVEHVVQKTKLNNLRTERDKAVRHLNTVLTRFKSALHAAYGRDSQQYKAAMKQSRRARKASKGKEKTEFRGR